MEIRQIVHPHVACALRAAVGRREEHSEDGRAVVQDDLAVRFAHGTGELFLIVDGHAAPVGRGLFGIYVRLAAGVIVAGVGVRVVRAAAAADAIERVGARGDGLCLERLLLKRGGHFRAQHAEKVCAHVHLLNLALNLDAQRFCAVALAGGGDLTARQGRFRAVLCVRRVVKAACRRPGEDPDEADQ